MRFLVSLITLLIVVPLQAQSTIPRSSAPQAFSRARAVLVPAAEAHGGFERLRGLKTQYRAGKVKIYNIGQGMLPNAPVTLRDAETEQWLDYAGNRVWSQNKSRLAGVPIHNLAVMSGDSGYLWNAATGAATRVAPTGLTGLRNILRRDPVRLVANALARPEAVRYIGTEEFQGTPHDVLVMAEPDGGLLTLYFDAKTHLLSKFETWSDTSVIGDTLTEQIFSDYRTVNGVKVPFRLTVRNSGQTAQELTYTAIRFDETPPAAAFDFPKDLLDPSPIATAGMHVTTLGPGVHLIGGGTHSSLAVEFRDYVVVVDAPLSSERSRAVLDKIRELAPGKPVRWVVPTHHHFDHSGGLREYIAEGVTVVTHPGNAAFIRSLGSASRSIRPDRLSSKPVEAKVETVSGKRTFSDGEQTLEIHPIVTSHAQDMLIAYLPKQKILFNADLFSPPLVGPVPVGNDFAAELLNAVRSLGLQIETLVVAHGRVATLAELEQAVSRRPQM